MHSLLHTVREYLDDAEIALHYVLEVGHLVHFVGHLLH
jgi:hypothetical protein